MLKFISDGIHWQWWSSTAVSIPVFVWPVSAFLLYYTLNQESRNWYVFFLSSVFEFSSSIAKTNDLYLYDRPMESFCWWFHMDWLIFIKNILNDSVNRRNANVRNKIVRADSDEKRAIREFWAGFQQDDRPADSPRYRAATATILHNRYLRSRIGTYIPLCG